MFNHGRWVASISIYTCHSPIQAWTLTDSCVLRMMLCFLPRLMERKHTRASEESTRSLDADNPLKGSDTSTRQRLQRSRDPNRTRISPEIMWCHRAFQKRIKFDSVGLTHAFYCQTGSTHSIHRVCVFSCLTMLGKFSNLCPKSEIPGM